MILYDIPEDLTLKDIINIPINSNKLLGFYDAAHANDLKKWQSTTGIFYIFMGGAIIYKSKTQSIISGRFTESEFIGANTAAKNTRYLYMLLKKLGYEQKEPTPIYIDNFPAQKMINDNTSPTEQTIHIKILYFAI